jgi:DNA-binding SARP family transcriptional activator
MTGVDYRILGSLEATRGGKQLPLGGAKQRAVLVILLSRANRVVTTDELIEALWPQSPPSKPHTAIQGYVSQLRKTLDPDRPFEVIVTEPAGYRMPVGPEDLDLFRLESLLRRGRDALGNDRAEVAERTFREALSLFRGPPLADFTYESWAQTEIGRLVELRLTCLEERIDADLRLGRHAELVGEIEALIAEYPLREHLRAHQMLALYRGGRQSESLAAYQEARKVLVEEFGIEPTRALQELERKILLQDPELDLEPVARGVASSAGVLTLLLTDIEGSTRLLHRLGQDYAHVLVEHRRLLREAFESESGRIVDNYGDCFFAVFDRPIHAAAGAGAAQRALASYPWPNQLPVKVRMGIHTGEPIAVGDGFVGIDVHRAARICDAAHGGQVLLSKEAEDALTDGPPAGLDIRDLGDHRLRDLPQPERLFQLVVPGLEADFPPPRTDYDTKAPLPDRSILIVPWGGAVAQDLVDVGAPLANSHVPHELIVAQLIEVADSSATELGSSLARTTTELQELRAGLVERGLVIRVAAFTSTSVGEDIVRLASEQAVDLVLLGRSRESLEGGTIDVDLHPVLADAPCDVAVCLLREAAYTAATDLVLVPFGGGMHDWAALELGAWLAAANGWRLRLLGVTGDPQAGKRDASRLLAAASLAVQQLVGVLTEPALLPAGAEGLLEASQNARVLVAGVPDDWRERGLGQVRAKLAAVGPSTTLFVRRGIRPGGLAPSDGQTRFTWSLAEVGVTG